MPNEEEVKTQAPAKPEDKPKDTEAANRLLEQIEENEFELAM